MRVAVAAGVGLLVGRGLYRQLVRGALTVDAGIGRRTRRLGPVPFEIGAPREVVFEVIASPYLGRTPRALQGELEVWERGSDMVLAAHHTQVKCGTATTLETVRFERPARIDFRVVRGPVPHVAESFVLEETAWGTRLTWDGDLGTDFWGLGTWWGDRVARHWERAVRRSLAAITAEAERRSS
ncbi:MAG TPA: SRPBCC family protein [Gaiellaceae bacterium]|nr:SRPBCC family protein [Gaiellaceae bacterium]